MTLIIGLPLASLSAAADPYQPVRALLVGVAAVLVALAVGNLQLPGGTLGRIAFVGLAVAVVGTVVAAAAGGLPSAVFGVHGRFQGLVSGLSALVALGVGLLSGGRVRYFARALAIALVIQCAVVLYQAVSGDLPTGTMGNQVLAGAWIAVAASMVAAASRSERGVARGLVLATVALAGITLGVAGSRGAWVGLAVGLAAVGAVGISWKQAAAVGAGLALLVAGALVAGGEAADKLDPSGLSSGSARTRALIWQGTASMIADDPVLGIGPGRYLYEFPAYQPAEHAALERGVRPDQAHSIPLHVAAESGIPAAIGASAFIGAALIAAVRRSRQRDAAALVALGGLAAWSGQAMFGISTIETDALAFACAGVALARLGAMRASASAKPPRKSADAGAAGAVAARRGDSNASSSDVPASWVRPALGAAGLVLAVAASWYLIADTAHLRGVGAFYAGDMATAWSEGNRAVEKNPLVDLYRIGAADAALYGAGSSAEALALVEEGMRLEPVSYDLAAERARLLASAGATSDDVFDASRDALALYPLGIDASHVAIQAAFDAGEPAVAAEFAARMLEVYPDDPFAASALEGATDGS